MASYPPYIRLDIKHETTTIIYETFDIYKATGRQTRYPHPDRECEKCYLQKDILHIMFAAYANGIIYCLCVYSIESSKLSAC